MAESNLEYPIIECNFDIHKQYTRVKALMYLFPIAALALVFVHPLLFIVPLLLMSVTRVFLLKKAFPNKVVGRLVFDDGTMQVSGKQSMQLKEEEIKDIHLMPVIIGNTFEVPLFMPRVPAAAYQVSIVKHDGTTEEFIAGSAPIDAPNNKRTWIINSLYYFTDKSKIPVNGLSILRTKC